MATATKPADAAESGLTLAPSGDNPAAANPAPAPVSASQSVVSPVAPAVSAPAAPVAARPPKWRKVHHARLVTLPDGSEQPQGAIFDASGFDRDLLAHYEDEGYLLPSDAPEVQE